MATGSHAEATDTKPCTLSLETAFPAALGDGVVPDEGYPERPTGDLGSCTDMGAPRSRPLSCCHSFSPSPPPPLPFRELDGKAPHKALPLGSENDRVFNDLWGKGGVPMVLNNPYSEKEQVSDTLAVSLAGAGESGEGNVGSQSHWRGS